MREKTSTPGIQTLHDLGVRAIRGRQLSDLDSDLRDALAKRARTVIALDQSGLRRRGEGLPEI